jgi:hypothetical protein
MFRKGKECWEEGTGAGNMGEFMEEKTLERADKTMSPEKRSVKVYTSFKG